MYQRDRTLTLALSKEERGQEVAQLLAAKKLLLSPLSLGERVGVRAAPYHQLLRLRP
jgi:hypothetical protein